jgi:TRAP-type C4-dicarboxylate transport system permease small subunit
LGTPLPVEEPRRFDYRPVRLLVLVESIAVVALLLAILAITTIQVVSRYVLNISVQWTEELAQLALVWLVFIGAGLVSAQDGHVTLRVFGKFLGARGRRLLAGLAYVAVIASAGALIWLGIGPTLARMKLPLPGSHWPAGLHYVAVLTGFALTLVHTSVNLWILIRGGYREAPEDIESSAGFV